VATTPTTTPTIVASVDSASWEGLVVAPRVIPPSNPADVHLIVRAALRDGARVTAAVAGDVVVGLAVSIDAEQGGAELIALGVAPGWRRMGLGRRLLGTHVAALPDGLQLTATVTVAERDVVEPLAHVTRIAIARRLLTGAGFELARVNDPVGRADPLAIVAVRR